MCRLSERIGVLCEGAGKREWITQLPDASGRFSVGERYGAQTCGICANERVVTLPTSACRRALLHGGSTSGTGFHGGGHSGVRLISSFHCRYESCVQWDVYHLDAQQRLAELKECNSVREHLNTSCSSWFQKHPDEESAVKLVKKISLTHLASLHPMLLSEQRLQTIAASSPSNERIQLSVAHWLQKRGDWLGSQHVLEM